MSESPKSAEPVVATLKVSRSWKTHIGVRPGHDYGSSTEDPEIARLVEEIEEAAAALGGDHGRSLSNYKEEGRRDFDAGTTTLWIEVLTVSAVTLAPLLRGITPLLVALIEKKARQEIRLKVGEVEVELKGTNDIEAGLHLLERASQSKDSRIIIPRRD
jgi:hypothetical protein